MRDKKYHDNYIILPGVLKRLLIGRLILSAKLLKSTTLYEAYRVGI